MRFGMTVREMKNDALRKISLLSDNDANTMRSIWLYISTAIPQEKDNSRKSDERAKAKELAHSYLGAFSASKTADDWKQVKEDFLVEKYGKKE